MLRDWLEGAGSMLGDWFMAVNFFWRVVLLGLLLLGAAIGCGGLWLVQTLISHAGNGH